MTGYSRERSSGRLGQDVDRNGCDTRNDILAPRPHRHDLQAGHATTASSLTGHPARPVHRHRRSAFVRGGAVRGRHRPRRRARQRLGRPARHGWTDAKRVDPRQRSAEPARRRLVREPPEGRRRRRDLATAEQGVTAAPTSPGRSGVKDKYGLYVTPAEKAAMRTVLRECPGQPLPTGGSPARASDRARPRRPARPRHGTYGGSGSAFRDVRRGHRAGYGPYRARFGPGVPLVHRPRRRRHGLRVEPVPS